MIKIHNPVMKMISVRREASLGIEKTKRNVVHTFIFSLRRFDRRLPNQVVQLKMDSDLPSYS